MRNDKRAVEAAGTREDGNLSEMYAELDRRIIDAIKNYGRCLSIRSVRAEAQRISEATGRDTERIIDGRTQTLRKRGVIEYVLGKWYVVE